MMDLLSSQFSSSRSCRQPFAVELTADGRPFGQVAEALLTVGGKAF